MSLTSRCWGLGSSWPEYLLTLVCNKYQLLQTLIHVVIPITIRRFALVNFVMFVPSYAGCPWSFLITVNSSLLSVAAASYLAGYSCLDDHSKHCRVDARVQWPREPEQQVPRLPCSIPDRKPIMNLICTVLLQTGLRPCMLPP